MAHVNFTEEGCVAVKPTRMFLIEKLENRRYSLSLLFGFSMIYWVSAVLAENHETFNANVVQHAIVNFVQSLF